ncbi:hypothetical protein BH23GEM10_BH23GEM10_12720 [soil metagenome]
MSNKGPLDLLGMPAAEARVIRYFLVRPDARPYLRELQRTLRLGGASVQRALERLVELGALRKADEGGKSFYSAVAGAPAWRGFRLLESATQDPAMIIREALADVSGIDAAFIFGSVATDQLREDSDVDIFVVAGQSLDRKKLYRQLSEASLLLGREVNIVRYTVDTLADRLGDRTNPAWGFVHEVLNAPKKWIVGADGSVAPIAAAAGISRENLLGTAA